MPSAESKIIVIADDLSGAAELAGIAFAHGHSAEVQRHFEPSSSAEFIAIDTDSRHLPSAAAAERVKQLAAQIVTCRPAWIFKKVDSVLRGNPRAEIEAVLQVTRQPRAILVPANPSRGRVVQGGRYSIDGIPLDQTHFARDPQNPRLSSDVFVLLGLSTTGSSDIAVPDVETGSQLEQIAAQCDANVLAAGAADFFTAVLRHRAAQQTPRREPLSVAELAAPALLVCGSRAAWPSRRQQCAAAGIPIVAVASGLGTGPRIFRNLLIGIDESERANSDLLLSFLARFTKFLVEDSSPKTLLVEGGATAAAIADEMQWPRFHVAATAPAGVGVLRPLAPAAPVVLIKPGSYPWPAEIWQSFCQLRSTAEDAE